MMAAARSLSEREWLLALAHTRLQQPECAPSSVVVIERDQLSTTLRCPAPEPSSAALAAVLLNEFSRGAQRSGGAKLSWALCGRGGDGGAREPHAAAAAAAGKGTQEQQQQEQQQELEVTFVAEAAAGGGAAASLPDAAALFEPFLHYHLKAAKSAAHTRMRQRLGVLRQQLQRARQAPL